VWREDGELVPIGKAYSGYTDEELTWLDRWIRNNTVNRFGPVREVERGIVFEVAFDAAQLSSRHKSGVALRFPRIARIRRDKPVEEADRLATVLALVGHRAAD
jgi:DNA ligase-1